MPLPKPRPGEPQDDYISRCMGDEAMQTEHRDRDERFAVCQSLWGRKGEAMAKTIYGDTEGPLGLMMKDEVAREVERILKDLPSDCRELVADGPMRMGKAAVHIDIASELEPRTEVATVTMDTIDRDNEVMLPKGMDWRQWAKNPVVTLMHNYDRLPVGRGLWAKRFEVNGRNGYKAKTEYISKPDDWKGDWDVDAVWHYVQSGFLPGRSIGFIPTHVRAPSESEIKDRPELAGVQRVISDCQILEYAVCTVQSNPDALIDAAGKGFTVPKLIADDLGMVIPEVIVIKAEPEPEPPAKAEEFNCECIKCGHKMKSEQHCKEVPCPECGGTMRREERPGPGEPVGPKDAEPEPEKSIGRLLAGPDDPSAITYRTPDEIVREMRSVTLETMQRVDIDKVVQETLDRMSGRID